MMMNLTETLKEQGLMDYQIERVLTQIDEFKQLNNETKNITIERCPKCGAIHPYITRSGYTKAGKQMLLCHECGKRFVHDHGQLTFYSHQSQDKWNELIGDSIEKVPLKKTAEKLNVNESTVFRMRHKLMNSLEEITSETVLSEQVELDEKYFIESFKGCHIEGIEGKKRGTPAGKRGISNEQVCLLTGVERNGSAIARSINMGSPNKDDILSLRDNLEESSFCFIDGKTAYNALLKEKKCPSHVCKQGDYDHVNHLNNVNSFHSKMQKVYEHYRGVASKYINRYAALFVVMRQCSGMSRQEKIITVMKALRKHSTYFYVREIRWSRLFNVPLIHLLKKAFDVDCLRYIRIINKTMTSLSVGTMIG